MKGILQGLRVLDLSDRICGAYATKLLADAGAEVTKLEPPGGDPLRRRAPSSANLGRDADGALFAYLNTSKRSHVADLETSNGRARAWELAAQADLVFETFEPGVAEAAGLGAADLWARAAGCSLVSISSFGRGGPWSQRPATEFTLQALCGSTGGRGVPERPPLSAGGELGEWIGGLWAAIGALLAARRARETGRGDHVDVSLLECMSVSLSYHEHLKASLSGDFDGFIEKSFERQMEVPSIEKARDGYVGFALFTAAMWESFCEMVECPELGRDAELRFMLQRWPRRAEVNRAIRPWLARHSVDAIVEEASRRRIPVARIGNGATTPEMDHFRATGSFVRNPGGGFLQPRVPYSISGIDSRPFEPPPGIGQHDADPRVGGSHSTPGTMAAKAFDRSAGRGAQDVGPLEGLRVVDFTQFVAGPAATSVLALMGADVVKIESIQRPDGIRFASARPPDVERWWEYSWVFHGLNANKRSITLDMRQPEGGRLARALIRDADLVVENFSPRVMDSFGLGWEEIQRLQPRASLVRMPAFGSHGPWRDRVGFAQTMEQLSGMAYVTGFADGLPVIPRGVCDGIAGLQACFASLLAIWPVAGKSGNGRGHLVECNMVESALGVAAESVVTHSAYGVLLERDGNRDPFRAPQNLYACRGTEQWLALSVETDAHWRALCVWLGDPSWARDEAFADTAGRRAGQDRIDAALAAHFAEHDLEATVEGLVSAGIPAAPVVPSPLVMRNPQHLARGFYETVEHPVAGAQPYPRLPMRFAAGPERHVAKPAPLLGQDNDAVLGERLGLDANARSALREAGVVGERPHGY